MAEFTFYVPGRQPDSELRIGAGPPLSASESEIVIDCGEQPYDNTRYLILRGAFQISNGTVVGGSIASAAWANDLIGSIVGVDCTGLNLPVVPFLTPTTMSRLGQMVSGNDTVFVTVGNVNRLNLGEGHDTVSYANHTSASGQGVRVFAGVNDMGYIGDRHLSTETFIGSQLRDEFILSERTAHTFIGGGGRDMLAMHEGTRPTRFTDDMVITVASGSSGTVVFGGATQSFFGISDIVASLGNDTFIMSDGADNLLAGGAFNVSGFDTADYSATETDLVGSSVFVHGDDSVGNDTLESIERIISGSGNDFFWVGDGLSVHGGGGLFDRADA
jgi:hypothetical protein